jgi:hypothetical protein
MGILERLYYFALSEISQALLRRPWNYTAIWQTHMILCIKHMPHKSIGARRGNQGKYIHPRITVKMGILERLYYYASSEISQALLRRPWNCRVTWHTHMILCINHMPQKSMGARRRHQGNHIYPRITVKMGILERLYYLTSSEISQGLLRRLWSCRAIWHTHMVLCIKHMPHKSMGARRGNQGNHIFPGSLWKWAVSRDCTTLHRQKSRKPF